MKVKQEVVKVETKPPPATSATLSLTLLSSLQELRRRLELAESGLTSHLHVPLGENGVHECSVHIQRLQVCRGLNHCPSYGQLSVAYSVIVCIYMWVFLCF